MLAAMIAALALFSAPSHLSVGPLPDFVLSPNELSGVAPMDLVMQLDRVNRYVNANCVYTDQGDSNPWGRCGLKGWHGNCKDFALEKRAELMIAGLDPKRMGIWFVWVPVVEGDQEVYEGHAVLVVDNTWVLDNRFNDLTHRGFQESQGYEFVCRVPDKNLYDGPSHIDDPHRCTE